ncbi:kelch-like protein 5 isoform X3, partial [Candidatus Magnetomorum sp. HK-1]
ENCNITGNWESKDNLPTARGYLSVQQYQGKIYVIGGNNGYSVKTNNEIYEIATNTWSSGESLPAPRYGIASAILNDNIYVIGGNHSGYGSNSEIHSDMYIYNISSDTWIKGTDYHQSLDGAQAVALNGKIYVSGGASPGSYHNSFREFDPSTNLWTLKADMNDARAYHGMVAIDDKIYVFGGRCKKNEKTDWRETVEEFNYSTNSWVYKNFLPVKATDFGYTVLNGKIYLIGGRVAEVKNEITITEKDGISFMVYNPQSDCWTTLNDLSYKTTAQGVTIYQGKIYSIGGMWDWGNSFNTIEIYKP